MTSFSSLSVAGWLILAVFASWLTPRKWQPIALLASGTLFLGILSPLSLAILAASSGFTYFVCRNGKTSGKYVAFTVCVFSALFAYFKLAQRLGPENVVIPLGLSYYLFRQTHYLFEQYKGALRNHSFVEYMAYLFLMPTIIVGPIHRFPEFFSDLRRRRWEWARFSLGLERAFHGYAKLIIIANFLISSVLKPRMEAAMADTTPFWADVLKACHMWIDLYVRFSAYSDIAIGVSGMMGFTILENFNRPFLAKNVSDFWARWHISLTSWCRDYAYKPIAAVTRRPIVATACAMLIIGLWHEVSLRYVLWGVYHAIGIAVARRWGEFRKNWPPFEHRCALILERCLATALTLTFVVSSFPVTNWVQQQILNLLGAA